MTKTSIGTFLAALRKANGMTQQEVADRLHVSNKAVSRWERDECAPDLTIIPALAEMFGVTCDELLRGERSPRTPVAEPGELRAEKQLRTLVRRTVSDFKTQSWISITLSVVGYICMLGISYGFYRPVIGFAVMLLFAAAALVLAVIAANRMKETKTDNELFAQADAALVETFDRSFGTFSCAAVFAVTATIVLSLPLVVLRSSYYVLSVLGFLDYCRTAGLLALVLIWAGGKARGPLAAWITGRPFVAAAGHPQVRTLHALQLGALLLAGVLFLLAPYCETDPYKTSPLYIGLNLTGLALLLANIVLFFVYRAMHREDRAALFLPGLRNMLMTPAGLLWANVHTVSFSWAAGSERFEQRHDWWDTKYLWLGIGWVLLLAVVFAAIQAVRKRRRR